MAPSEFFVAAGTQEALPSSLLVLPSVAVGNVGQLVVDLLVHNLQLGRAGSIAHSTVLPVCGADPYAPPGQAPDLATSIDVYRRARPGLTVLQQRAPVAKGCHGVFCAALGQWLQGLACGRIVLLTSLSAAAWRHVDAMVQGQLCFLATARAADARAELQGRQWVDLEGVLGAEDARQCLKGGVAPELYRLALELGLPLVVVVRVCSEGDNIQDAMATAAHCADWLALASQQQIRGWSLPPSWGAMYGSQVEPAAIY